MSDPKASAFRETFASDESPSSLNVSGKGQRARGHFCSGGPGQLPETKAHKEETEYGKKELQSELVSVKVPGSDSKLSDDTSSMKGVQVIVQHASSLDQTLVSKTKPQQNNTAEARSFTPESLLLKPPSESVNHHTQPLLLNSFPDANLSSHTEATDPLKHMTSNILKPLYLSNGLPQSKGSSNSSSSSFFIPSADLLSSVESSWIQSGDSNYQPEALREHPYMAFDSQLNMSTRCDELACDNAGCNQIKCYLSEIQQSWKSSSKRLSSIHGTLLVVAYDHCVGCDLPLCPFYWCSAYLHNKLSNDASVEQKISTILLRICNFVDMKTWPDCPSQEQFMKFDETIPLESLPEEGQVWTRLCMMGHSGKAMLVRAHPPYVPSSGPYWVVKRVTSQEDSSSWNVYAKLRQLKDPRSVTPLLWAVSVDARGSDYVVCSAQEGLSLHEHLQVCEPLASDLVVKIMAQVVSSLAQLHLLDIVYLNWTSKNILVFQDTKWTLRVKIINFDSSAVVGQTRDADSALPVHLLPPELLSGLDVQLSTDLWGVACLMFELTNGRPVWHEHRHMPAEELEELMRERAHPDPPLTYPSLRPVFEACWRTEPKERIDVTCLRDLLGKC